VKLAHALHQFRIDPEGGVCLDVGASTGGFTDCLLQHGARKVWAIDVGTNQLDYRIRTDERVVCFEGVNAREFDLATVTDPIDIMVADVSFISLILAIPPLLPLLRPEGKMILLVKPQFEAGRGAVGKGGIVRDPVERERAVNRIIAFFAGIGYSCWGITPSPVEGRKGNVEYLIWLEAMHEGVCGRIVSTADVTGIFPSQTEM
jgi:23S rRNA (cytidine1920-2'-O)/16S rRNA (cytidine1409-2'-O)-methyltransferase